MNKNRILAAFGILIVVILLGVVFSQILFGNIISFTKTPTAIIDSHSLNLLIASSAKDKQKGLSGKTDIPKNQGMVFLFGKADYYSFWMKDMKFSIDIIYLRNKKIVTIYKNAKPPKSPNQSLTIYQPTQPADTVLEINGGLSDQYKFKNGDLVKYENLSG